MSRPLGARAVETRLAEIGFHSHQAIANGLGIQQCACGMAGGALVRSALNHQGGTPRLWQVLATAIYYEHRRNAQMRALAREDRVLAFLFDHPGSNGNQVWRGVKMNRNDIYGLLLSMEDAGLITHRREGRTKLWSLTALGTEAAEQILSGAPERDLAERRRQAATRRYSTEAGTELTEVLDEIRSRGPEPGDEPEPDQVTDVLGNVVATKTAPADAIEDSGGAVHDDVGDGGAGLPDSALFDGEPERPGL